MRPASLALVVLLGLAAPAVARGDRGQLLVGARVGAAFADAWSRLGPSYVVGVDAGWAPPVLRRRLFVAVDAAFTAPSARGEAADVNGAAYRFRLTAREVILGASIGWRQSFGRVTPYAGVGPRLFVVDSAVDGSGPGVARLPAVRERAVAGGGGGLVGVGVRLGPGAVFADLRVDAGPLRSRTTGDTVVGAIFVAGGYRLAF